MIFLFVFLYFPFKVTYISKTIRSKTNMHMNTSTENLIIFHFYLAHFMQRCTFSEICVKKQKKWPFCATLPPLYHPQVENSFIFHVPKNRSLAGLIRLQPYLPAWFFGLIDLFVCVWSSHENINRNHISFFSPNSVISIALWKWVLWCTLV